MAKKRRKEGKPAPTTKPPLSSGEVPEDGGLVVQMERHFRFEVEPYLRGEFDERPDEKKNQQ